MTVTHANTHHQAARQAAIRQLITNHQDEYDTLHRDERVKRGLPAESDRSASIQWLNQRLTQLEHKLLEHGIEP